MALNIISGPTLAPKRIHMGTAQSPRAQIWSLMNACPRLVEPDKNRVHIKAKRKPSNQLARELSPGSEEMAA